MGICDAVTSITSLIADMRDKGIKLVDSTPRRNSK